MDKLLQLIIMLFLGGKLTTAVIVVIAAIIGVFSVAIFKQPAGNPVEKAAENVIEAELGLTPNSVDLTPTASSSSTQLKQEAVSVAENAGEAALATAETALIKDVTTGATASTTPVVPKS